jgi:alpha-tubulin suppressor-like RCC1 family protein
LKRFSTYMRLFVCFTIVVSMMPLQWTGTASAAGLPYAVDIARSNQHSLVLKSDGTVWAWGANGNGQLGDGTYENRTTPVQVQDSRGEALNGIIKIATGYSYSLALKSDGTVWSWGDNEDNRALRGTAENNKNSAVQVQDSEGTPIGDITMISAGESHKLALKSDGTVWSWGANWDGQLGDGTTGEYRNNPVQVVDSEGTPLSGITTISAGASHSLALKSDGTAWAWGGNWDGQLGDGTDDESKNTPVQVQGSNGTEFNDITMISAGAYHGLALKSDGTLWSWGNNGNGQLGDGTERNSKSNPVQVIDSEGTALSGITKISAGAEHNFGA